MFRRSFLTVCSLSVAVAGCLNETKNNHTGEDEPDETQSSKNTDSGLEEDVADNQTVTDDLDPEKTALTSDLFALLRFEELDTYPIGSGESLDGGDLQCRITSLEESRWNVFDRVIEDSSNDEAN